MFMPDQITGASGYPQPVHCNNYGQIDFNAGSGSDGHPRPRLTTDPMRFVSSRGSAMPASGGLITYLGASLLVNDEPVTFDYKVADDLNQKSFNIGITGFAVISSAPVPAGPQYCP